MLGMNQKAIEDAKNIVLIVQGGIGRNIMATAVVRNLKKAYPSKRIVVVCGYPDIFLQNPHIYRVFNAGNPVYLYEDFIKETSSVVLNVEPYQHYDFVYKRKHFVECWCELIGIPCDNVKPEIFFTDNELELAQAHMYQYDKDFVLCQFEGGKTPEGKDDKARLIARNAMYRRTLPEDLQKKICDTLQVKNYRVGVVAHENQFTPGGSDRIFYPLRAVIALIPYTRQIICIDSFLLHAAACFQKPVVALWSGTSPTALGYEKDINLRREVCETPECGRPNSYLFDISPSGYAWECPWNNKCCDHTVESVMAAFDKVTDGKQGESRDMKKKAPRIIGSDPYDKHAGEPVAVAGQGGAGAEAAGTLPA